MQLKVFDALSNTHICSFAKKRKLKATWHPFLCAMTSTRLNIIQIPTLREIKMSVFRYVQPKFRKLFRSGKPGHFMPTMPSKEGDLTVTENSKEPATDIYS